MQHRQGYNFATGDDIARRTAREIFEPCTSVTPRAAQPCKVTALYRTRVLLPVRGWWTAGVCPGGVTLGPIGIGLVAVS